MGFVEIIGQGLGAIFAGGATGLLGTWLTARTEMKRLKEQNRHDEIMAVHAMESMKLEAQLKLDQTVVEGQITEELAAYDTLKASFEQDKSTYFKITGVKWVDSIGGMLFGFVDFVRGMIRPVITIGMAYIVIEIHNELLMLMNNMPDPPLTQDQAFRVYMNLNNIVLYIAATTILWWFGTRVKNLKLGWLGAHE